MVTDIKTDMLTIRIDKKTKAILKEMADKDRRSLSDWIRLELEKISTASKK